MSKQRAVVITGGGTGMGLAATKLFAENGDKVFVLGRRLEKLQEAGKISKNVVPVQADITDLKSLEAAQKQILTEAKAVDVLVNCAGGSAKVLPDADLKEQHDVWNKIVDINLTGVFNMIAVFDESISDGGRIINVTSLAAINGSKQGGVTGQAYSAAKSGVHGMTRTLVSKFAPRKITINCVAPGVIQNTGFFGGNPIPDELKAFYLPRTPLDRLGEPEEIAAGIFYLASEDAGFITGEMLNINGGVQFGR